MGQRFGTAQCPTLPTQMCQGLIWGTLPHILRPLGAAFKLSAFIWSFELLWIQRVVTVLDNLPLDLHCNCGLILESGLLLSLVGVTRLVLLLVFGSCRAVLLAVSSLPYLPCCHLWLLAHCSVHPCSCCSIICSGALNPERSTVRLTFSLHRAFPKRLSLWFSSAGHHGYIGRSQPSVTITTLQ